MLLYIYRCFRSVLFSYADLQFFMERCHDRSTFFNNTRDDLLQSDPVWYYMDRNVQLPATYVL